MYRRASKENKSNSKRTAIMNSQYNASCLYPGSMMCQIQRRYSVMFGRNDNKNKLARLSREDGDVHNKRIKLDLL